MRKRKRLTAKEQVLHIYPDAYALWELTDPLDQEREQRNVIIIREVPQLLRCRSENEAIIINFRIMLSSKKPVVLSEWCFTEEECWENAWTQIQKDMLSVLGE